MLKKSLKSQILLSLSFSIFLVSCTNSVQSQAQTQTSTESTNSYSLDFDSEKYTIETGEVNGKTISFRSYKNIVYVKNPVDTKYQNLNFFVPSEYYENKSINGYTSSTAPIFLPNKIGGYMPAEAGTASIDQRTGSASSILVALSKGYIVASPGARGRTLTDSNNLFTGKAPAGIVDLKAAVRYLHYNDNSMPGNANKIISNGTSAGGAMSALLGATGNNIDYKIYLDKLGAAEANDDIFAVSSYCPITNLDNADSAYEWIFNSETTYKKRTMPQIPMGQMPTNNTTQPTNMTMPSQDSGQDTSLTQDQINISNKLKDLFPSYLNSLQLKKKDGTVLNLDENGNGSFKDYVISFVIESAQKEIDSGKDLSKIDWITIKDGKVISIDFKKYISYATRMKTPPAFDALDLSSGENDLFGTENLKAQHFTKFGLDNSTSSGKLASSEIVKLMNPMNYIDDKNTTVSKHWRIRHGTIDRDTSIAIPIILGTKLQNSGYDVDISLPWDKGHGGDYDLDELFNWIDSVSK